MMAIEAKETVQEGPPFSPGEYAARADRAGRSLAAADLDGLLIAEPANVCYLTGYETNGIVATTYLFLSQAGDRVFLTRRLDIGNLLPLLDTVAMAEYAVYDDDRDPVAALADLLRRNGFGRGRIGVEWSSMSATAAPHSRFRSPVPCWTKGLFQTSSSAAMSMSLRWTDLRSIS